MATTTVERSLVKRKCNLQDRPGDFALVRKNVKVSLVRAIDAEGRLGQEEQVDTALVTNERKYEAPKPPKEDRIYEADRPERKVCLVKDRGQTRFHLLRQNADYSKILEVGVAGKGEWIANSLIVDKFMVPSVTRVKYTPRQPIRICEIQGREGRFLLLRQTTKGSRVIGPIIGENYGETVDSALIHSEQKFLIKKKKNVGGEEGYTETAVIVGSVPPEAGEPPMIPETDSPLHGHHPAVDQYPEPTQLPAQPPVQQHPVQQQPRPVQQPAAQQPAAQQPQRPAPQQAPQQAQRPAPQQAPQQAAPQQQVPPHPQQGQPQRPDPRFQPAARPQQVPQRPVPAR